MKERLSFKEFTSSIFGFIPIIYKNRKELMSDFGELSKFFLIGGFIIFLLAMAWLGLNDNLNNNSCDIWDMYFNKILSLSVSIMIVGFLLEGVIYPLFTFVFIPILICILYIPALLLVFPIIRYWSDIKEFFVKVGELFPINNYENSENYNPGFFERTGDRIDYWWSKNAIWNKLETGFIIIVGILCLIFLFGLIYFIVNSIITPLC